MLVLCGRCCCGFDAQKAIQAAPKFSDPQVPPVLLQTRTFDIITHTTFIAGSCEIYFDVLLRIVASAVVLYWKSYSFDHFRIALHGSKVVCQVTLASPGELVQPDFCCCC